MSVAVLSKPEGGLSPMTVDELQQFIMALLAEHEKRYQISLTGLRELMDEHAKIDETERVAAAHALKLASDSLNVRLEGMNAIREQLRDQTGTFLPIATFEARMQAINVRLDTMGDKINDIQKSLAATAGSSAGAGGAINWVIAGFGALGTVLGIIGFFLAAR